MSLAKKGNQTFSGFFHISQLTLPNRDHLPAVFLQKDDIALVAGVVAFQFRLPIISVCGGDTDARAT